MRYDAMRCTEAQGDIDPGSKSPPCYGSCEVYSNLNTNKQNTSCNSIAPSLRIQSQHYETSLLSPVIRVNQPSPFASAHLRTPNRPVTPPQPNYTPRLSAIVGVPRPGHAAI